MSDDLKARLQDAQREGETHKELENLVSEAADALDARDAEIARWKDRLIAYAAVWAASYARDHGLSDGHIAAEHYDDLEAAGARMDQFTRVDMRTRTALNGGDGYN
jgi:hypothetical protein